MAVIEKYKMNKTNLLFGAVFGGFGILMVCLIIGMVADWMSFKETALTTDAVITNIDTYTERTHTRKHGSKTKTRHVVSVEYVVDGEIYNKTLDHYDSSMDEGDIIEIYYNPDNPNQQMSDPTFPVIILSVFAVIFGGIGVFMTKKEIQLTIKINRLIEDGMYIYADEWTEQRSNLTVNNVRYKCAVATYNAPDGRTYEFTSNPYHPNKCPYAPNQSLKVYVDLDGDASVYYVSLEG